MALESPPWNTEEHGKLYSLSIVFQLCLSCILKGSSLVLSYADIRANYLERSSKIYSARCIVLAVKCGVLVVSEPRSSWKLLSEG